MNIPSREAPKELLIFRAIKWSNLSLLRFSAWMGAMLIPLESWDHIPRTDGGPLDVGDHIGNFGVSQFIGAMAAPLFAKAAEALPGKATPRRVMAGAIAGAAVVGAAANWLTETRTGINVLSSVTGGYADTHPWLQELTNSNPQTWDFVYGEAGAIPGAMVVTTEYARERQASEQTAAISSRRPAPSHQ